MSALTGRRQNDDRAVDAALQGLASTGGASKLDRTASLDQQTLSLFRTLNPAIGSYDPWPRSPSSAGSSRPCSQPPSRVSSFGNTVGLAGGCAALFLTRGCSIPPRTELRSALLREAPEPALCAAKTASNCTKFAYLWARRMPLGAPPKLQLARPVHLAIGLPATLPPRSRRPGPRQRRACAFRWKLIDAEECRHDAAGQPPGERKGAPRGRNSQNGKARDLRVAEWDWTTVEVVGEVQLHPLPELAPLRLTADSADRLVTDSGSVRARLSGAPAYFINGLHLLRLGDPLAKPLPLPFAAGPQGECGV